MAIDTSALVSAIVTAIAGVAKKDAPTVEGFAAGQALDIAQQAANFAKGRNDGSIHPEEQQGFLDDLAEMTRSLANTLAGMLVVEAEKIWNAAVTVVWAAISKAIGVTLTAPAF